MMETLQEAVKHRGSSLADEQYVDLFGRPGEQNFHNGATHEKGCRAHGAAPRGGARKGLGAFDLLLLRVPGLTLEDTATARLPVAWCCG